MEHRRLDLLGAARRFASRFVVPALLAPSCVTPAACGSGDRAAAAAAAGDTAARRTAGQAGISPTSRTDSLRDSAAALDERFQHERAALDAESRILDSLDRRTPDYARRFDAWRRRARSADSLRTARDRLRIRAGATH